MRCVLIILVSLQMAFNAQAQTRGPSEALPTGFDRAGALDKIYAELAVARDRPTARRITQRLFKVFMYAPDVEAANLMNQGMRAAFDADFASALTIFNGLTARNPDWPEAWNQRAYVHFRKRDWNPAIVDCEKTIELEPRHLGCLTGLARLHIRQTRRYAAGRSVLRRVLALHPHAYERVLLEELPKE